MKLVLAQGIENTLPGQRQTKGAEAMATMRVKRSHFEPRAIGLWLIGVGCGVLLMLGIGTLHRSAPAAPTAIVVNTSGETSGVTGGRLGGIASSDTATDWQTRQDLGGAQLSGNQETAAVGGRLGGITNSDAPAAGMNQSALPQTGTGDVPPPLDEKAFYGQFGGATPPLFNPMDHSGPQ